MSMQKPWEKWENDNVDRSVWGWTKAIMLLVVGIVMLALLAEPLIHSVQNVSNSATIPSFFVSFILVPLATNARAAVSAFQTASQRKERTTSLTFSEVFLEFSFTLKLILKYKYPILKILLTFLPFLLFFVCSSDGWNIFSSIWHFLPYLNVQANFFKISLHTNV